MLKTWFLTCVTMDTAAYSRGQLGFLRACGMG